MSPSSVQRDLVHVISTVSEVYEQYFSTLRSVQVREVICVASVLAIASDTYTRLILGCSGCVGDANVCIKRRAFQAR